MKLKGLNVTELSVETDKKSVVKDASFTLPKGELHILMGPNGSGKSSLLHGILGHPKYKITHGSIHIDGEDVTKLPTEKKAQRGLFLSMQHLPQVPGVTTMQFLHRAHKKLSGKDISVMDFYKNLKEVAQKLSINESFLGRELNVGFSGGEKKLSEILQLVMLRPQFALLDEIDSGVDVDSLKKVFKGINMLQKEGTGFLLVTHYPNILKYVTPDKVYVMKGGRI